VVGRITEKVGVEGQIAGSSEFFGHVETEIWVWEAPEVDSWTGPRIFVESGQGGSAKPLI